VIKIRRKLNKLLLWGNYVQQIFLAVASKSRTEQELSGVCHKCLVLGQLADGKVLMAICIGAQFVEAGFGFQLAHSIVLQLGY
jgi:hypothetical protein